MMFDELSPQRRGRHSESETMARAANQLMSESYKFPSVKRAVVAKQVHSSDKEDNARPQSVQEEARELRQLTLPSHHSGDALLVIVINGGVYKHSSSAELNVKEQMPHIPVDTRPARLTLRQLAREKKRQRLRDSAFPKDCIAFDLSPLSALAPEMLSFDVKLSPSPPEETQLIGYLVDNGWNPAQAHSASHMAIGNVDGGFRRCLRMTQEGFRWYAGLRQSASQVAFHSPIRTSSHSKSSPTAQTPPQSFKKRLVFDSKASKPAPVIAKAIQHTSVAEPLKLAPAAVAGLLANNHSRMISMRLSQFAPIQPRKSLSSSAARAYAKIHRRILNEQSKQGEGQVLSARDMQAYRATAAEAYQRVVDQQPDDVAMLEELTRSASSTASTCSFESDASDQSDLLNVIEGLTHANVVEAGFDVDIDELLQLVN